MTYLVEASPEAIADTAAIVRYYREVSPLSIPSFERELALIRSQLAKFPDSYQVAFDVVRRAPLKGFPYTIYYEVSGKRVDILAVFPQRSEPQAINRRLHTTSSKSVD